MTKADLIEKMAAASGCTRPAPARHLRELLSNHQAVKKGDKVALVGFGTFSLSKRKARTGRNLRQEQLSKLRQRNFRNFQRARLSRMP